MLQLRGHKNISVKAEAYLENSSCWARGKMGKGATSDIKFTETAKNVPETPSSNTPAVGFRGTAQTEGIKWHQVHPGVEGKIAEFEFFDGAYDIGSKMELFFDDFIISKTSYNIERSTSKKTRQSQVVLKLEYPWEMSTGYLNYESVVENEQDGSFLMYYRCYAYRLGIDKIPPWNKTRPYANDRNYCVAKSTDGVKLSQNPFLTTTDRTKNVKTNIIAVMLDTLPQSMMVGQMCPRAKGLKLWFPSTKYMELIRVERWYFPCPDYFLPATNASRLFFVYGSFNDW